MKTLSNYIADEQTALFKKHKAFFAFNEGQLIEGRLENNIDDNTELVQIASGMLCPKENRRALRDEHADIIKRGIAQDIADNGIDAIIERELANHEAYYTGELEDTAQSLSGYDMTYEDIQRVYKATQSKHYDD
jgi:hypothetical protein